MDAHKQTPLAVFHLNLQLQHDVTFSTLTPNPLHLSIIWQWNLELDAANNYFANCYTMVNLVCISGRRQTSRQTVSSHLRSHGPGVSNVDIVAVELVHWPALPVTMWQLLLLWVWLDDVTLCSVKLSDEPQMPMLAAELIAVNSEIFMTCKFKPKHKAYGQTRTRQNKAEWEPK